MLSGDGIWSVLAADGHAHYRSALAGVGAISAAMILWDVARPRL
jgi:hypothetical protein